MPGLLDRYPKNIYSQNGEGGILMELAKRLGWKPSDMAVVEFGAWHGRHYSNTFRFVENGARALYIEKDAEKFKDLLKTVSACPRIQTINATITPTRKSVDCVDKI